MPTHTQHTEHRPITLHFWWLFNILLILINTGHARQHIAGVDTYTPGIYHTFGDLITNTPDDNHAVVFDHEKGKLYCKDTGKKVRSRSAYGFCKDGQTYNSYAKEDTIRAVNHMILESDPTFYNEFINDKKRYQYYLQAYSDRNREELKDLSELQAAKPGLFQIENKYKSKNLPN